MKEFVIYFAILICLGKLFYKSVKIYNENKEVKEKIQEKFNLEHGIIKLNKGSEKRARSSKRLNRVANESYGKAVVSKLTVNCPKCNSSKVVSIKKDRITCKAHPIE